MIEKFTQGEWEVCYFRKTPFGLEHYLVHEPNYGEVAVVNFHGASDGETEKANADLIAAAPEMYRMLKYLADGVRYGGIQHTDRSLAAEIEKLLKKARGEK